jgi:hypothetical protein
MPIRLTANKTSHIMCVLLNFTLCKKDELVFKNTLFLKILIKQNHLKRNLDVTLCNYFFAGYELRFVGQKVVNRK